MVNIGVVNGTNTLNAIKTAQHMILSSSPNVAELEVQGDCDSLAARLSVLLSACAIELDDFFKFFLVASILISIRVRNSCAETSDAGVSVVFLKAGDLLFFLCWIEVGL